MAETLAATYLFNACRRRAAPAILNHVLSLNALAPAKNGRARADIPSPKPAVCGKDARNCLQRGFVGGSPAMAGKIFVNYRRDDARDMAARVRDRLAQTFGAANVFMDVDNLLAGQRFDKELQRALAQTDVFLAVIGAHWLDLLSERQASGERDYVREEIAGALARAIVVIPVLVERTPMPRGDALPEDIRELVLHQKHVVTHEQFGRDAGSLAEAVRFARTAARAEAVGGRSRLWLGALAAVILVTVALTYLLGGPMMWAPGDTKEQSERVAKAKQDAERAEEEKARAAETARQEEARKAKEAERQRLALLKALEDAKRAQEKAEVAERQRLAMLKQLEDAKGAEEERKRAESNLLRPGRVFRDCPYCPEMVVVPAGSFMMGSETNDAEKPVRKVTIARPFAVSRFEITFTEWEACSAEDVCSRRGDRGWGRGRRPVPEASWDDAQSYVKWLSNKTGKTYRLLTEAEWEYAARAGTTTAFSTGETINKRQAQFSEGKHYSARGTVEVGSFKANAFGLHDMHGNLWEWVEDCWHENYRGAPTDGSAWTTGCSDICNKVVRVGNSTCRVIRGGAWADLPEELRSANRRQTSSNTVQLGDSVLGLRVAKTLSP